MEQFLFSVVIPSYNRPTQLAACLESLTQLDYPRDRFEVIVVDDGSTVPIKEVVQPFKELLNLTLVEQPNAGPAAARNRGAKHAKGKYLAFTDDDCCPEKGWLKKLEKYFSKTPDCIVGGKTINILTENLFSTASQHIISVGYQHCNSIHDQARFFTSNNMNVPRKHFLEIKGFNEDFRTSEDREFCERWIQFGLPMIYVPTIVIYHAHSMSLLNFWKQHFEYGRGTFRFHKLRSQMNWGDFEIEGNYYIKLFRSSFKETKLHKGMMLFMAILMSQISYTLGFVAEKINRKPYCSSLPQNSIFSIDLINGE